MQKYLIYSKGHIIELKNDDLSLDKYVFISYMDGVYYVHKPLSHRYDFETLMIHESDIKRATLSK